MNKQVVSFLSLFSLVLVLSIYYVMLPSKTKKPSADPVISNVEEGTDPYFDMMILLHILHLPIWYYYYHYLL